MATILEFSKSFKKSIHWILTLEFHIFGGRHFKRDTDCLLNTNALKMKSKRNINWMFLNLIISCVLSVFNITAWSIGVAMIKFLRMIIGLLFLTKTFQNTKSIQIKLKIFSFNLMEITSLSSLCARIKSIASETPKAKIDKI